MSENDSNEESRTATTLCDCCAGEVAVEEAQTCYCGIVVCDRCMENEHYQCAGASS
jgi:hypothetical protein